MKKKRGVGRPKGSTKHHTIKGADPFDNELRAHWGGDFNAGIGLAWVHMLWAERHPSRPTLEGNAAARHITPEKLLAELQSRPLSEPLPDWAAEQLRSAIERRDAKFFSDASNGLARIQANGTLAVDSPHESALLGFVNWSRKYTLMGLMDTVPWRKWGLGCPSERELKRMCSKLGIPMKVGRPITK